MRSTMKTAIILSMLALMCNIDTNAQNTIEGRVTDKETRQPLESATVIIQHTADATVINYTCLLYTSPSPRDAHESRMPSSA